MVAISSGRVRADGHQARVGEQRPSSDLLQAQILEELKAIRSLLEQLTEPQPQTPPPPKVASLDDLSGYSLGRADAPLVMVEFTDLQCPFCKRFALSTFSEIKQNWIDTGKVRYVTRDFPLEIHAHAVLAARAARCAGEQDRFWEMRTALIESTQELSLDRITNAAAALKVDPHAFQSCLTSTRYEEQIRNERAEGLRVGVRGTPTFVVGRASRVGIEGPVIAGALPYAQFDATLKRLLESGH
jgi:protein-disulfide isomerase